MTGIRLDWNAIRPLNGSQAAGFEELCAQIARTETPADSRFERKGTPDAGVECYAVLSDGSEWGWQAKYFDSLGNSQWSQLDESVKTALEKHPRLVRYFICTPLDQPDARNDGQMSAKDKWDERVERWKKHASDLGMTVEFIYWGSHELLERLARSEHFGRVCFWFGVRGFDAAWFNARLDEALKTAGPRYTPEVHVDLPIASEFEAFGRTARFFNQVKGNARNVRDKLSMVKHSEGATDAAVDAVMTTLAAKVQAVLTGLGAIDPSPTGQLPFKAISEQVSAAEEAAEELSRLLYEREREIDAQQDSAVKASQTSYRINPFRNRRGHLSHLIWALRTTREALDHADSIAGSALMLLHGMAGTGKTHLLCDVAKRRIAADQPTILLMGQRFVSHDAPWSQALQHLDLATLSAEEFVGSLEAAAQAAGSRALLMVDAINEGAGRTIWHSHLEAFLPHLERSPWIAVVLAVRSSYEEIVIPASVRSRATVVTHEGFMDHEYDATKTFFVYYGLELPSTPLLAPEFRNPLFLKTLCKGLNEKNERRLSRGFQGITAMFDLYLTSVNKRLAESCGFDARTPLVRQALEAVARSILDSGQSWLTLAKAVEIVDAFLPGREFERSLYRGLTTEDVLVEEGARHRDAVGGEVVFLAYERFADHLTVKTLLDKHLNASDPTAAFKPEGPLAFVCDDKEYVSPGLLEALCVQIPERTGRELISIAPASTNRPTIANAFRQSLIWRSYEAFSQETRDTLNKLCRNDLDQYGTIEVLLTVATLPEHPFNAHFLDRRLRKETMADRDAWWSVYLHHAWGTHGAVDRLVDWASSLDQNSSIDDESIDLSAIALSWMLSTPNRFLRDRATKALVSLLTCRPEAVVRLVERFADVDDPYIAERVYAVAYGVAMRCHDPEAIAGLATSVYRHVFTSGSPPPHILLRDYARGVVERALHLGSTIQVAPERIRPPYISKWPTIPTDEDIKPLLSDWSKGSHDSGELEWGRNRIENSVMDDDFARYVIGTNSSSTSSDWLSLGLDEPSWKPPPRAEDLLNSLVSELSAEEKKAWDEFEAADSAQANASRALVAELFAQREKDGKPTIFDPSDVELEEELNRISPPEIATIEERRSKAVAALEVSLTAEHAKRLKEIQVTKEKGYEARQPPRFDLRQIQRYILKRVFDLGWTVERFGRFDRFSIEHRGREASKAERIGKKYQWIAYHEIMAFISDRFQYREQYREEEGDQAYEGPWQDHLRDIDPSCTIRSLRGGTSWDGHTTAWWGASRYDAWGDPNNPRDWVMKDDNLPKVEDLLIATNPTDGSRWINGQAYFDWKQQPPADQRSTDVERREIWYICIGYLLREAETQIFLDWAEKVDFWGRWMPEPAEVYRMFLGEHAWAEASHYFQKQRSGDGGWLQPDHDCPVKIQPIAFEYLREGNGFDCSIDEGYTLRLPATNLVTGMGMHWSGNGADFVDNSNQLLAQDPTVHVDGPNALLFREDALRSFLAREKLSIAWTVLGEKHVLGAGFGSGPHYPSIQLSGAYVLGERGLTGFMKQSLYDPAASSPSRLNIVRI